MYSAAVSGEGHSGGRTHCGSRSWEGAVATPRTVKSMAPAAGPEAVGPGIQPEASKCVSRSPITSYVMTKSPRGCTDA